FRLFGRSKKTKNWHSRKGDKKGIEYWGVIDSCLGSCHTARLGRGLILSWVSTLDALHRMIFLTINKDRTPKKELT
ncbi:MAG: hypothetical protein Q8P81_02450, partial [Nanoarchaeota archaeon]|nr:hypothetical protein [Nanoarchaeota archaeon]